LKVNTLFIEMNQNFAIIYDFMSMSMMIIWIENKMITNDQKSIKIGIIQVI